ncbi:MAG: hypothetical protein Q8R85_14570 [Bosea sp. (in: a-proteobacteria)]|uniref:hypothetical protein n=1 Tax=Bosea sp. (in: a-proteobacteria) TaxID=1871050 RepID=UPI002733BC64|nr:hypothetical protein [Bosea sp. (in: a-proteobacteria)]MDP3602380.1 hypothetical protein [Bosea sp. (in: a-proteobacteria)]
MTRRSNPRPSAPPITLHGIELDPTLRPVLDEISALRLHNPSFTDYAAFVENLPSIVAMAERARGHADEVARFIALSSNSARGVVQLRLVQLYSMASLNAIATVAIALMPPRSGADRFARRQQGHAFLQTLEDPHDEDLRFLGELAFSLKDTDAAAITQDAIAFAAGSNEAPERAGRATSHRLEEQLTLSRWLNRETDVDALMAEAHRHGQMASRCATMINGYELEPREHHEAEAARQGAVLQNLLALAALALSKADVDTDVIMEAAVEGHTREQRAALLVAIAVGKHHRAMIAAIPY